MNYRFRTGALVLLLLGLTAGFALARNADADGSPARASVKFSGTLFFTPEQRLVPDPTPERASVLDQSHAGDSVHDNDEIRTIRLSFNGLMNHRGRQVVWISGRPLGAGALPDGIRSVVFDAELELVSLELFVGGVYRLTVGECLLSDNQIVNCNAAGAGYRRYRGHKPEGAGN